MPESSSVVTGPGREEEPGSPGGATLTSRTNRRELNRNLGAGVLAIAGLSSLAFAQPVYDVLRRAPEFFAIRNLYMSDLLALVTLVTVVPTLALSAPAVVLRLLRPSWIRSAIATPAGLLAAVIALQAIRNLPAAVAMTLALAAGAAAGWAYIRFRGVRSFALLLSAAAILVPALLVLDGRVRRSAANPNQAIPADLGDTGARAPVVLVIFDEWSLTSILDAEGSIDRERLPNLARLADQATWYPNATAAADVSELALPAMLTGQEAEQGRLPTLAANPVNLFTVLAPSHDISAIEPITSLCPPELNLLAEQRPGFGARLSLLLSDLRIVWLNLTLPAAWTERLPEITRTWSAFGQGQASTPTDVADDEPVRRALRHLREVDRAAEFRQFITAFKPPGEHPGLYFMHSLLPHTPWEYLPSGRSYQTPRNRIHGLQRERWTTEPWHALHSRKRYLLQVQFVDRLIGELVAKLEALDLFDPSVIAIAADHGVSFLPGKSRRFPDPSDPSRGQLLDLASVPLLIKAPFQQEAEIDDKPTSLVALTPRILELAGADASAIPLSEDTRTLSLVGKYAARVEIPIDRQHWRRTRLGNQAAWLGVANDPLAIGAVPSLHGRRISELPRSAGEVGIQLEKPDLWDDVSLDRSSLPAIVQGTLTGPEWLPERSFAVALNGVIGASVRPYQTNDGEISIAAMLPDRLFRPGLNQVDVFLISERGNAAELQYVERPLGFVYELSWEQGKGDELLRRSRSALAGDVERIPVVRTDPGLIGYLEGSHREAANIHGWAVDLTDPGSIQQVVAFLEGRQYWIGTTHHERPNVAERYGREHLYSGFIQQSGPSTDRDSETDAEIPDAIRREGIVAYAISRRGIAVRLKFFHAPLEFNEDGVEILPISDGRRLPVRQTGNGLEGAIDLITKPGRRTLIEGWAADVERGERPRQIVIYRDGSFMKNLGANRERPDVAAHHDNPRLLRTGFRGVVSGAPKPATFAERHRVFALTLSGFAVELPLRAAPETDH
ncbi:MAG: sulfatase-like hydrolase/transferase [Holophagales bacterium]|nr:sulfatase-like hydrolase/transferase [Holophagales bacterium]MYC08793.1 sulfatase-like hydrolase/transferase [Holophagales bacterium]